MNQDIWTAIYERGIIWESLNKSRGVKRKSVGDQPAEALKILKLIPLVDWTQSAPGYWNTTMRKTSAQGEAGLVTPMVATRLKLGVGKRKCLQKTKPCVTWPSKQAIQLGSRKKPDCKNSLLGPSTPIHWLKLQWLAEAVTDISDGLGALKTMSLKNNVWIRSSASADNVDLNIY